MYISLAHMTVGGPGLRLYPYFDEKEIKVLLADFKIVEMSEKKISFYQPTINKVASWNFVAKSKKSC